MPKTILVVDDEPDMLKICQYRLKKTSYNIDTAIDGQDALNKIKANNYDLILLDLRLPLIDGYEVCRILKQDEKYKNLPIIIMTAFVMQQPQDMIKEMQVSDVFIKPMDMAKLLERIQQILN